MLISWFRGYVGSSGFELLVIPRIKSQAISSSAALVLILTILFIMVHERRKGKLAVEENAGPSLFSTLFVCIFLKYTTFPNLLLQSCTGHLFEQINYGRGCKTGDLYEDNAIHCKLTALSHWVCVHACQHGSHISVATLASLHRLLRPVRDNQGVQSLCRWLLQHENCASRLYLSFFEVPDTFKVKETDKERIRNMENEIEKGRGELSRRQNQEKAK